jgi:hypothetical protein
MPNYVKMVEELKSRRDQLDEAIAVLQRLGGPRRGRPPGSKNKR